MHQARHNRNRPQTRSRHQTSNQQSACELAGRDGGEASWEAAHLTLPLQRCGGPTRWERQVADGAWAVVRAALHDRTLLAEDVEEDALARHLVVHPVPVRRQRARLISAIPGSQVQPPPHESAARRTLNEQACR